MGFPLWAYQTKSEIVLENPEPILVHNFPNKWESFYLENKCSDIDPVITHGKDILQPFRWSSLTDRIDLTEQEIEYQHTAEDHGMKDGFAIPIIGANGRISMISLTTDLQESELDRVFKEYTDQILALSFAFHSIAKDFIRDDNLVINRPDLTPRERECMLWAAKSKSSWETGKILGISERTVVFHIENAKKKFGVTSKYHLIVRAISDGYIKI